MSKRMILKIFGPKSLAFNSFGRIKPEPPGITLFESGY